MINLPFTLLFYILETRLYKPYNPKRKKRKLGRPKRRRLICHAVAVYASTIKAHRITRFDTDSATVGIDNRASGCFSHVSTDFVGPLRDSNRIVKGFGGTRTSSVKIGTLKWTWLDDQGKSWTHYIPNSFYSPTGGVRLLSPQHFAQQTKDMKGTGSETNGYHITLHWDNRSAKLTVPLSPMDNVATFHLAPGFHEYQTFCHQATVQPQSPAILDNELIHELDLPRNGTSIRPWSKQHYQLHGTAHAKYNIIPTEPTSKLEQEYLTIHNSLGHIHPDRMQLMVQQGTLPAKFKKCRLPFCASCAFGKATRKPWRSHSASNKDESLRPQRPGECISVDQLISPTPGLIAQMSGKLTTQRYTCATIYVDQYSGYSYVWIQRTTSVEDTLKGKHAFERFANHNGISIRHYHADNGIFRAKDWVQDCHTQQQTLSYAAVGAHHQNGVAERRIRVLQDMTRTQLLHAQSKWPSAINAFLWPYALRIANDEWNFAPNPRDAAKLSPIQRFTNTKVQRNVQHAAPFGCPAYVLTSELQARLPFHKWKSRANVGIYLGKSPLHARNVALIMDRNSGRVSPQYHVKFDKEFDTVKEPLPCSWMNKAGFVRAISTKHSPKVDGATSLPTQEPTTAPLTVESSIVSTITGSYDPLNHITETYNDDILSSEYDAYDGSLIAMKAQSDPDTMYHHQAMREPDHCEFTKAMDKEIKDQMDNGNFILLHKSKVPKNSTILNAVWQMKRKRDIRTGTITKYKARLNIDGSKMVKGRDYDLTYAPVATWNAIRLVLTMVLLNQWHTVQLDYVLAFPQAPINRELYMRIPTGMQVPQGNKSDYVLQLKRNVYGQKQAARVWNQYLSAKLTSSDIGFTQSKFDECVFYKKNMIYILYTDDSIIAGSNKQEIDKTIALIRQAGLDITIEGDIQDFLGINITRQNDTYNLTQPQLINSILRDLHLDNATTKPKDVPMASSRILHRHATSKRFDGSFNYRSVVGKMNYLEKASRPDLSYSVHQCARFSADPSIEHGAAIKWIGRYLKGTSQHGTIMKPNKHRGLEVHVDADFVGNWDPEDVANVDTAKSRHGYCITYAGCPICWKSQLQPHIALSSSESEYIGLSSALREAIPIMNLLTEMAHHQLLPSPAQTTIHCKVFEDNIGALEMAREHKFRPRTKHMHIKYHHFRSYVDSKQISIHHIGTDDQYADILTKPLPYHTFSRHRKTMMGW